MDWYRLWVATMTVAIIAIGVALIVLATIVTNGWFLILSLFGGAIYFVYHNLE